jgi:hypothetical protein
LFLTNLRNIFFLLLFSQHLVAGKSIPVTGASVVKHATYELKAGKHLTENGQHKNTFKLQYKPKGTEVIVPHISQHAFQQFFSYRNTCYLSTRQILHFSFGYTPGKRGPPHIFC